MSDNATLVERLRDMGDTQRMQEATLKADERSNINIGLEAADRIAELEDELDRRLDEIKTAAEVNGELEAERDRLREALVAAEQVLDAAQIAFRGRDMDTREMQIMQACQIVRDAARAALLSPTPSGE